MLSAIDMVKYLFGQEVINKAAASEVIAIVDQMERDEMTPYVDARTSLYHQMKFCPVCGSFLALLVVDVKECPHLHGKIYMTENSKGMPAFMFEPTGD